MSFRANTDTTQYTAANRLISTNRWYQKIITIILDAMDGWDFDDSNKTDYPIATANLVASQQDYAFPSGILKVKRVEATYDGTNWFKAEPFDINQHSGATNTTSIAANFTVSQPFYDLESSALKLYPIPTANVTAGLKIWYAREPAEFTSAEVTTGTKEPGFDKPFHIMLALGMCYDWFSAKDVNAGVTRNKGIIVGQQGVVNAELQDYEARLRKYYGSKQTDSALALKAGFVDYN